MDFKMKVKSKLLFTVFQSDEKKRLKMYKSTNTYYECDA